MDGHNWPLVRWVLLAQAMIALVSGLFGFILMDIVTGLYTLAGGLFAAFLTLIYALRAFSVDASQEPHRALQAIYRGVMIKMALAGLFFALLAKFTQADLLPMLIGFVLANFGYRFAFLKSP